MKHLLWPDGYFRTVTDITAEELKSRGIRAVLSDIDNTLVPYEEPVPTMEISGWIASLREAGITVGLISNNDPMRVDVFNRQMGLFARAKAGKPSARVLREFLAETKAEKKETILIGDQIFTDVLCARFGGVNVLLVPPIRDKKTLFFRFKRALEKPFMRAYKKKNNVDF